MIYFTRPFGFLAMMSQLLLLASPILAQEDEGGSCPAGQFRVSPTECRPQLVPSALPASEATLQHCLSRCADRVQSCVQACGSDIGCNSRCSDDHHYQCLAACRK